MVTLFIGMQNDSATMIISYKVKNTFILRLNNATPRYLLKRNGKKKKPMWKQS